jgi:hypothetical protein
MTKYDCWYDQIITAAQRREIPRCYSELHHIKPRSLGGGDDTSNLVRLTYREHFLVHWLLTKTTSGGALRKMQRALFAMTLKGTGERITAGWQFEAAKRAVRDLELDPELEAVWRTRFEAAKAARIEAFKATAIRRMIDNARQKKQVLIEPEAEAMRKPEEINALASAFLSANKRPRRRRNQPYVRLFDHPSREERIRQASAIIDAALAE